MNNHPKIDIEEAKAKALLQLEEWYVQAARQEIEAEKWPWRTPPRIRDIVDTGRLRDSAVVTRLSSGGFSVTWTVPYASNVHEGGVHPKTNQRYEGRPWTRDVNAQVPAKFAELFQAALAAQQLNSNKNESTQS